MEIQTMFGAVMVVYYLTFADCGVAVDGEEYVRLEDARDIAFDISAETNRRVNILECFGLSEHLVEQVLA